MVRMILRYTTLLLAAAIVLSWAIPTAAIAKSDKPITPPDVRGIVLVHHAKPSNPGKPAPPPPVYDHYELLGLELTGTVTYYVNPDGSKNEASAVATQIQLAFEAWDGVTAMELLSYGGATDAKGYSLDGQNTISWVGIAPTTIVAITVIWYVEDTDGDGLDEILEFDVIFNALLKWGIDPDGEGPATIKAYDIRNVATHEAGHVVGLADLYDAAYRELTMYGYTSKGESKKISLEAGDIAGAQYLYGAPT